MKLKPSPAVAHAVQALQRSHPDVPPLDLLDLVMQGRSGSVIEFADADCPGSTLGQMLAACFDRGMTPEEWKCLTGPAGDPELVVVLRDIWRNTVLAGFAARYHLTMEDGRPAAVPVVHERRSIRRLL